MTSTPEEPATDTAAGPRVNRDEVLDFGRLRRTSGEAAKAGGVAGGLARHFDIDPVIVRVLFVVTALFGVGILAYGALWLLVPGDNDDKATIGLDDSTRSIVVIIIGVLTLLGLVGMFGGGPDFGGVIFFGALAIGAVIFLKHREQRAVRRSAGYDPTYAVAQSPPPDSSGQPIGPEQRQQVPPGGYGGYGPPPAGYRPPPPRIPNPRKRGPLLFGFSVALLLLLLGLLGTADVAGMDVPNSAYPALVVAVTGVMLVVGAWYGRAGGLIALGLIASLGLAGATAADNFEGEKTVAPTTSIAVLDNYKMGIGEFVLDLSDVSDPESLAGRNISIEAGVGHVVVVLPAEVDARVNATVDGPGNIRIMGEDFGGVETQQTFFHTTPGSGTVTIDVQLGVGEIEVRTS